MRLRLSLFWFLYLGGFGIFFPYYSLFLGQELELTGSQVGVVMAMIPLVGLVAQPLWGHLADRTGSRPLVLALLAAGAAATYLGLTWLRGLASAWIGTAVLAAFAGAVMPMATAISMAAVRTRTGGYGTIRMWGTAGFLVMVVVFPLLPEHLDRAAAAVGVAPPGLRWMFPATATLALAAAVVALRLRPSAAFAVRSRSGDARLLFAHPPVRRLAFLVLAVHGCIQGPIFIFPLYVAARGGDLGSISRMWILMLLLEIPLIGFSGETLSRLGPRGLLTLGLAAEGVRWLVCGLTTNMTLIAGVQLLHGVGVAGIMVGAPLYLELATPERLRATGQALISAAGLGAGAIISTAGAGWLFEHVGVGAPYAAAGVGALTLGLLLYRILPEPHRPTSA